MDEERTAPASLSLILLMGVPGSGKSTLARQILNRFWLVYLDNNFIADAFFSDTRMDPEYVKLRSHLYDVLYRTTEENLRIRNSVLLDVPHVTHMKRESWRSFIQEMCSRVKATLVVLRCFCSEDTLQNRLRQRGEQRDEWKLNNWTEFLERESLQVHIPFVHCDIDTDQPIVECTEKAVAHIWSRTGLAASNGT